MEKKGRKIKIVPVIITVLLFLGTFISLFMIYKEVIRKNDYKEKVKSYIETLNSSLDNKIYNYNGEYNVQKNMLLAESDNDSFKFDYNGNFPKLGSTLVIKENTVVSAKIYADKYLVTYKKGKIKIKKGKFKKNSEEFMNELIKKIDNDKVLSIEYNIIKSINDDLKIESLNKKIESLKSKIYYSNGEQIMYNPIDDKICEDKDNCYKFTVINYDEENSKLRIILNENLDNSKTAWYETSNNNSKGPETMNAKLNELTNNWKKEAKVLTYDEAINLGCTSEQASCPSWLYATLDDEKGFWTSSARNNKTSAWYISNVGALRAYTVNSSNYIVRPVIEIDSSKLN